MFLFSLFLNVLLSPEGVPTSVNLLFVCLSRSLYVCLSIYPLALTRKPHGRTSSIIVHVAYGPGSVFLWRRCNNTLCTSVLWMTSCFHFT